MESQSATQMTPEEKPLFDDWTKYYVVIVEKYFGLLVGMTT